jgi:predicted DNA-binding transcriptional regulator AlpA
VLNTDAASSIDPILPPRVVADWIGVDITTIYRWARAGTFVPKVRLGARRVGFLRSAVEAWLADQTR